MSADNKNLVKATDLPLAPAKPATDSEQSTLNSHYKPGFIALKLTGFRQMLEPVFAPVVSAADYVGHIVSTGVAHSQAAWQKMDESQTNKRLVILGLPAFFCITRRGFFKKIKYGLVLMPAATAVCFPEEAKKQSKIYWYIAKNKLPSAIKAQKDKLFGEKSVEIIQVNENDKSTKN